MTVEIVFSLDPAVDGDLLFGDGSGPPLVEVAVTGSFAPLAVSAGFAPRIDVAVTGSFAPLTASAGVEYRTNTSRPTVGQTSHPAQSATSLRVGRATGQQDAPALPVGWATPNAPATKLPIGVEHRSPNVFVAQRHAWATGAQDGTTLQDETTARHQDANRAVRKMLNTAFENASLIRHATTFRHQDGTKRHTQRGASHSEATPLRVIRSTSAQSASPYLFARSSRYQEGAPPPPGISVVVTPVDPELPSCYDPSGDLLFGQYRATVGTNIVFICDGYTPPPASGTIVIPVRRAYIVINNVNLRRVSDNAVVPTLQMSMSIDFQSWSWTFSASLPAEAQSLVEPTSGPVELKALVNGTEYRVLAESLARERVFGQTGIKVSGRGKNAVLDAPYAAAQTFGDYGAFTAQQLMDEVLKLNGVTLGWSVDWGIEDWNVPAGVFNHQGTHITALNAIAGAAGAYLLPHPSAQTFRVRHKYPTAPWEWASVTPDYELPAAVTTRESLTWKKMADYNRVYVSGQDGGVLGQVTRTGTAGDIEATMVVDQLITAAAAARQRGLAILGDTGHQRDLVLRLPVLAETGVIEPGKFVEYVDGGETRIGLVRSTNVDFQFPEVWQTIGVETHDA